MRFPDDVAPPHEHREKETGHADGKERRTLEAEQPLAMQGTHPDNEAHRRHKRRRGTDGWPRTGVHQVVVVMLGVRLGHLSLPDPRPALGPGLRAGGQSNRLAPGVAPLAVSQHRRACRPIWAVPPDRRYKTA